MQTTPEYARTVERRREQIAGARDEWWMVEIEALIKSRDEGNSGGSEVPPQRCRGDIEDGKGSTGNP